MVEIATKYLSLTSKMIVMKSHVVTLLLEGGQRNAISTGPLCSWCNSQQRDSNSDNTVLTIILRYTAASVFRTADSLTPFRDSVIAF